MLFLGKEILPPWMLGSRVQDTWVTSLAWHLAPVRKQPGDVEILAQTHTVNQGHVGQEFKLLPGACTSPWPPCAKYI